MKAKTFENLIRKVVREEIDYALRREIKPTIVEHTERIVEEQNTTQQLMPETAKHSLREKIMGSQPIKQHTPKNFTSNSSLNDLLNETAMGNTNTDLGNAPVSIDKPFSSGAPLPMDTTGMPQDVASAMTRDYSGLMKAIEKKKGR